MNPRNFGTPLVHQRTLTCVCVIENFLPGLWSRTSSY